jgi:hypothetical protein
VSIASEEAVEDVTSPAAETVDEAMQPIADTAQLLHTPATVGKSPMLQRHTAAAVMPRPMAQRMLAVDTARSTNNR